MAENGRIRVFLVDDHEMVRRGVRDMLSVESDIEIVGEAGTAAEAIAGIGATHPDVAVLDIRLPDDSGVEVCREIRSHDESVRCMMLTSFSEDEALLDSIMAGASGYAPKAISGTELLTAVRDIAAGKSLLDPVATRRVLEQLRGGGAGGSSGAERGGDDGCGGDDGGSQGAGHVGGGRGGQGAGRAGDGRDGGDGTGGQDGGDERLGALTEQEHKILDLIGEGLTNRAIGEQLHLAEKTIKNYVSSLLAKLGMERRSQAAAYVARLQAGRGR
ncbi:response regulator transcription factor [Streptomyces sp. NBC_01795]|uniref:response regulator transcription factor n=1 Tax=Streptomyces sp. NBC_01795 TaxID=2975943 RepID=UPI002DD87F26|nr:response regulator transcription factor [Streptomyces sp. NBC_01795]